MNGKILKYKLFKTPDELQEWANSSGNFSYFQINNYQGGFFIVWYCE